MKLITRHRYLDALLSVIGTPDIKVITGIRRSGKSKLLEAVRDYVKSNIGDANIIHVNFNLDEYESLLDYRALLEYVRAAYRPDCTNFVFIDEIQMCSGFEKAINSLHASENYDIFITESNAFLLSSDLATLFTGRAFELEVYPFSFAEFCDYYDTTDIDEAFDQYTIFGGMSGSYLYREPEQRYQYVANVFRTLIVRDIRQRYNIRNQAMFESVANFLLDNISNITSIRSIANAFTSAGVKANHNTVSTYIDYLCDAFAFYRVRRWDVRGKKYLNSGEKYYLSDHAFKYALLGTRNLDWGRTYENMVAIELLRRGYEVYVGVLQQKEIDFVALKRSEKLYIQVSDDISNPNTFKREIASLLEIRDAYPKMILARTKHEAYTHEGVHIVDLARWLKNS